MNIEVEESTGAEDLNASRAHLSDAELTLLCDDAEPHGAASTAHSSPQMTHLEGCPACMDRLGAIAIELAEVAAMFAENRAALLAYAAPARFAFPRPAVLAAAAVLVLVQGARLLAAPPQLGGLRAQLSPAALLLQLLPMARGLVAAAAGPLAIPLAGASLVLVAMCAWCIRNAAAQASKSIVA